MSRELSDWIDNYLDYSSNSEPPHMYHLWSAITLISATLKRKCYLEWGSLTFYPNIYVVLVGPPAARKGTAMSLAKPFLDELQIRMSAEATTREALILSLKESNESSSSLDGKLSLHSSLTIWSQELTVFLGHQNFQLMSDLTDWYDCRAQWTYRTKNMGTDDIIGVYVTLFGATTPDLIRTALPLDAIGGGLTSRIIFVNEYNKGKVVPWPGFSEEQLILKPKLLKDLNEIHNLHGRFVVTDQFMEHWFQWYPAQENNPPFNNNNFAGYIERRANHIMKLSMIFAASRHNEMVIRLEDLKRAIKILELTEQKMVDTFRGVGQLPYADTLTKIMTDIGRDKVCLFSEILARYSSDIDKWRLEQIIQSLQSTKFIIPITMEDDIKILHKVSVDKNVIDIEGNFLKEDSCQNS